MLFALFSWGGRMGRLAYFGYSFLLIGVLTVIGLVLLLPLRNAGDGGLGVGIAIGAILVLALLYGGFCLAAKRLHDLDLPAWHYAWIVLLPAFLNGAGAAMKQTGAELPGLLTGLLGSVISLLVGLYLLFWPGTDGPNNYGER
jgi:uncharacterized membrane protein YhaH (DUF805 family)